MYNVVLVLYWVDVIYVFIGFDWEEIVGYCWVYWIGDCILVFGIIVVVGVFCVVVFEDVVV